jgi:hypothetical protein
VLRIAVNVPYAHSAESSILGHKKLVSIRPRLLPHVIDSQ